MMAALVQPSPSDDDWQNDRSVLDCNRHMLDNQIECDVHFTILPPGGETVHMGAHKFALISRSPVFFAMLSGPLANKQEIKVTDIAPSTFLQILQYLYCEEIELTEENVFSVLYAAKKYLVKSLATKCMRFLDSILGPENVCAFLENAFLFEEEKNLKKRCFEVIQRQSKRVFHSDAFYEISKETLCQVLKMDRLSVHEVDVFRACVHWAERKVSTQNLTSSPVNKRNALGEALFLIHIPSMNINEFTKIVVPTGILDMETENYLFRQLIGGLECSTGYGSGQLQVSQFPQHSRNFVSTRCEISCDGFVRHTASTFQGIPGSQHSKWSLSLYCDHSIKIQEIGFLGSMKGHVSVVQNGCRKLDLTSQLQVQQFQFGDDLQLDAGLFTITTDGPFTYSGQYFSRGVAHTMPSITTDHDKVNILVRDSSALCFMSYLVFAPIDDIYFIENYYSDDSMAVDGPTGN